MSNGDLITGQWVQMHRRSWERLLPFLEQAHAAASGEDSVVRTELANLRNLAYCQTEGAGDAEAPAKHEPREAAAAVDDWLSL